MYMNDRIRSSRSEFFQYTAVATFLYLFFKSYIQLLLNSCLASPGYM